MAEILHLIKQCLICFCHGFSTKTGGEEFLEKQGKKENSRHPLGSQMNQGDE